MREVIANAFGIRINLFDWFVIQLSHCLCKHSPSFGLKRGRAVRRHQTITFQWAVSTLWPSHANRIPAFGQVEWSEFQSRTFRLLRPIARDIPTCARPERLQFGSRILQALPRFPPCFR